MTERAYGHRGKRMMPWKQRSLYTGQEQDEWGGGAEVNDVFEGQRIRTSSGVPDFTCQFT